MEASISFGLIGRYSTLLLLFFIVVFFIVFCSARLPFLDLSPRNVSVKRKGFGKKIIWIFASSFFVTAFTFLLLYSNEISARKKLLKLSLVDGRIIEFPNILEDMDKDLYVPFRCLFPEEKARARFYRYNRGKKENINRKIDAHKSASYSARISLTGDGDYLWIDGGSVDVNIPISGNCIKNGKVKLLVALYAGSSEVWAVPFEFETLAPTPESRNAWTILSNVTYSEIKPGVRTNLTVDAINSGDRGQFEFIVAILDPNTQLPASKEAYRIDRRMNVAQTIQHGGRHQHQWNISFKHAGAYLLNTCVKKKIEYFDLPVNRTNWGDSYNYQSLFVAVAESRKDAKKRATGIANAGAVLDPIMPSRNDGIVYDAYGDQYDILSFETETQLSGSALYEAPSADSKAVATNIRKGALVRVYGDGMNAGEIIANADRFVKTEVVKLNKSGYMKKNVLSRSLSP